MFADVAALGLALVAAWIAQRPATPERSFGFMRPREFRGAQQCAVLFAISDRPSESRHGTGSGSPKP